jgi:peroxiredoxin
MKMALRIGPAFQRVATVVIIVGLSTLVVLLGMQNNELKEELNRLKSGPVTLKVGDTVHVLNGATLAGTRESIPLSDGTHTHLLFMFSTSCHFCIKSVAEWNRLADTCAHRNIQVWGVTTKDTASTWAFVRGNSVRFPVLIESDSEYVGVFKVFGVPQTILVSEAGIVIGHWAGEIDRSRTSEIFKKLAL